VASTEQMPGEFGIQWKLVIPGTECGVVRHCRGDNQSVLGIAMVFGKLNGNAGDACGDRQQRDARTIEGFLEPCLFRTWQVNSATIRQPCDCTAGDGRNRGAVPTPLTPKTPTLAISRLNHAALLSAAYAALSVTTLACKARFRLVISLYRAGVEPAGLPRTVSGFSSSVPRLS